MREASVIDLGLINSLYAEFVRLNSGTKSPERSKWHEGVSKVESKKIVHKEDLS